MGRFAAFGPIINLWAVSRPLALLYNGGPLCGLFAIFSKHPEFGELTLYILLKRLNLNCQELIFLMYDLWSEFDLWSDLVPPPTHWDPYEQDYFKIQMAFIKKICTKTVVNCIHY